MCLRRRRLWGVCSKTGRLWRDHAPQTEFIIHKRFCDWVLWSSHIRSSGFFFCGNFLLWWFITSSFFTVKNIKKQPPPPLKNYMLVSDPDRRLIHLPLYRDLMLQFDGDITLRTSWRPTWSVLEVISAAFVPTWFNFLFMWETVC